ENIQKKRHYKPDEIYPISSTIMTSIAPDADNRNVYHYHWNTADPEIYAMIENFSVNNLKNFSFLMKNCIELKGNYSIRLYLKLEMEYGLAEGRRDDSFVWYLFKSTEKAPSLYEFLRTDRESYPWASLDRRMLSPSIKEINKISKKWSVEYEPLYNYAAGSKPYIYAVKFRFIRQKEEVIYNEEIAEDSGSAD
ncbi:MAG: replication initiation protein, partial [Holdemanella sp.]|nr:replication initiation protein [Holdemanella sp.]